MTNDLTAGAKIILHLKLDFVSAPQKYDKYITTVDEENRMRGVMRPRR